MARSGCGKGAAAGKRNWHRGAGLGEKAAVAAVALIVLLALAVGRAADAAEGSAAAAGRGAPAGDQLPALPALVALPVTGPLTALGGFAQSLTCMQTPVAVDAAGRTGMLAPHVGVTVIRGSAAPSLSLTWVVVPAGQAAGSGQGAITVCTPTR